MHIRQTPEKPEIRHLPTPNHSVADPLLLGHQHETPQTPNRPAIRPSRSQQMPPKKTGITRTRRIYCPSSLDEAAPAEEISTRFTRRVRPTEGMSFQIAPALGLSPEGENR